jgi:signal transduction histidine kinase/CheY-like chemotaxis protein
MYPELTAPPVSRTAERRDAFLIALNDRLRPLRDPHEIQRAAVRIVGEHLDAAWVHYADCDDDLAYLTVSTEYLASGMPSLIGRHALAACKRLMDELAAGRTAVNEDVRTSPLISATRGAQFAAAGTLSFLASPIVKDGQLIATISVGNREPRVWTREEIALVEETAERTWAAVERARAEQAVAIELRDTRLLQNLSARLVTEADVDAVFDAILEAAIAITGSAAGTIRLLDAESNELVLSTTRGIDDALAMHVRRVGAGSNTSPGRAFSTRQRTFVDFDEVAGDDGDQATRTLHAQAGIISAQTTPLVTRGGHAIGTLTTHWRERRRPSERELRFLDLLARQAADLIERRIADEALRNSERRLSAELADMKLLQSLSAELIREDDTTTMYATLVEAASAIMQSDFGVLQIVHPDRGPGGTLQLIASHGFSPEAAEAWRWTPRDARTTCGLAMRRSARVVAPNIAEPTLEIGPAERAAYLAIGVHAAQTTPLVARGGNTVGMISTFWRRSHRPTERDLRLLDIVARQAADLLERAQAAETLRRNDAALKEADRRKNEFLAVLAHELRNPLAPIRTSLELMRVARGAPEVLEEARATMERQVGHMVRLIDDLLDVSRIASGKIHLQRQRTSLQSVIDAAMEANRAQLAAGEVHLDVRVPQAPLFLDVDATRFIQVLSNVLHNGIKFSRPGGRVAIAVTLEHAARGGAREVRFVVSDTGAGIAPQLLPRVFELFAQDDASARGPGLGIGLALARQLIEMHGGSIAAHSDGVGRGSEFTIRLPIAAEVAAPAAVVAAPAQVPRSIDRRVVVIDDNADGANAMRRLVNLLGGDCRAAYSGEDGLAEVLAFRPDVVFLDIGMPGMDGYEVCRRIRREAGYDAVVVALTGWGQERNKEESRRAGFDAHLTKPADPAAIQNILTAPRSVAVASTNA